MNKPFLVFFALILSLTNTSISQQQLPNTLLYEITGNGNQTPSYLYGTMHIKDTRAFDFQDSVIAKLKSCDAFAMEVLPDSLYSWMFDKHLESKIKELIFEDEEDEEIKIDWSDDDFEKIFKRASKKMGRNVGSMDKKDPQLLNRIIDHSPDSIEKKKVILDVYLFDLARRSGSTTHSLEIIDSAYTSILSKNYLKDSKLELKTTAELINNRNRYEDLRTAYVEGDLNKLLTLMKDTTFTSAKFYKEVLIERNYKMVETIKKLSKTKSTFVTCGAGHLPGKEGIIDLLIKEGYSVKPIVSSKTQLHESYDFPPFQYDWPELEDQITYFKIKTPGKPFSVSVPFLPNDFYVYMNPITQEQYLTMAIGMMQSNLSDKKKLENFADEFGGKMGKHVKDVDFYKYEGEQAAKVIFGRSYFSQFSLDLRMVIRDDIIYILVYINEGSEATDFNSANKFFNSLTFTNIEVKGWKPQQSKNGAFKAIFPGQFKSSTLVGIPSNDAEAATKMAIGQDPKGKIAMVMWMDYYYGLYFDNDLEICKLSAESYAKEMNIEVKDTLFNYINGIPHYTCFGELEGTPIGWKVVLRGTRVYLLVSSTPNDKEILDFFNSFELLPYTSITPSEFTSKDGNFKIDLTGTNVYNVEEVGNNYSDYSKQITLETKSFNDGINYGISCDEFKTYHSIPDSNFISTLITNCAIWNDSIITQDTITFKQQKAIRILSKSKKGHVHALSYSFIAGNKIYRLFTMGKKSDLELPRVKHFYESFQFINKSNLEPSILGDFTAQIISGLKSQDSTLQSHASYAFYELKDSIFCTSTLIKMLKDDYPNFTDSKSEILSRILMKIKVDSLNDTYFDQLYKRISIADSLTNASIFNKLSNTKSSSNYKKLVARFLDDPTLCKDGLYSFISSVEDSAHLIINEAHRILPLLRDSNHNELAIGYFMKAFRDSLLDVNTLSNLEEYAEAQLKQRWDKAVEQSATREYYYYSYRIGQLIEILSNYPPNDFKTNVVEQLLKEDKNSSNYLKKYCYLAQHRWFNTTDYKAIQKAMKDNSERLTTYNYFNNHNLLELLPEQEMTNKKLTLSYISDYYSEDWGEITDYELEQELSFDCEGVDYKVNLFEIQFKWDDEGNTVWVLTDKTKTESSYDYDTHFPLNYYKKEFPTIEKLMKTIESDSQCKIKE